MCIKFKTNCLLISRNIFAIVCFFLGLSRGRWDTIPHLDPFLPCSSHFFESHLRPMVLARQSNQGTDRSTSSTNNSGGTTVDNSTPTSDEFRALPVRPITRYITDTDGFLSRIHPILTLGRNHRSNTTTTSASNNVHSTTQASDLNTFDGQLSNL